MMVKFHTRISCLDEIFYFRCNAKFIFIMMIGPLNDELILHTLNDNKEPSVKELTDDNFEHLTQVSTGATTGDWFVLL